MALKNYLVRCDGYSRKATRIYQISAANKQDGNKKACELFGKDVKDKCDLIEVTFEEEKDEC